MSEILNKIGIIENPFSKDVNGAYVITILNEIEKKKSKEGLDILFDRLFHYHLDIDWGRSRLEKYLRQEHSWIDSFLNKAIFEIGKEIIGDDNFYYYIGKNSLNLSSLHVTVGRFFTIKGIYKVIEYANKNYNNVVNLKVHDKTNKRNLIVIRRWSKGSYIKKILRRMDDDKLLRNWMKGECDITKGILEAIPTIFHKPTAKVTREPECEGRGDLYCSYFVEWELEKRFERLKGFATKLYTLDHHWQMKERITIIESTIQDKTRELSDANYELEKVNKELRETQVKLVEADEAAHEKRPI